MSKSGKSTQKPAQQAGSGNKPPLVKQTPAPERRQPAPIDRLARPEPETPADPLLKKIFWGIAAMGLLALIVLSLGSGINADDKFQVDYSQKLVNYYGTFGQNTGALNVPEGNMHLYGGFFEVVTGFANKAFGLTPNDLAYHQVRHAASAVFGWIAILCAALLARLIAGWRAGLLTLIVLLVSPRFVGDAMMNPKDIPFAAGYMLAIYNMAALLQRLPTPGQKLFSKAVRWNMAGLVLGLGVALGTRAGGLLSFAILFLFAGLHFLLKNGGFSALGNTRTLGRYIVAVLGTALAGYVLAILFWPYALQNPVKNPLEALSKFSALEVQIRVLFDGANVMSDKTPWNYPIKWIYNTIPLAVLVGFVGSIALLPGLLRRYNPLWVLLALFTAVFPVFYVIYKDSVIHDGWRHLTFAYPPMAVAAGLFWNRLADYFDGKKALQYAVFGVFGLLLVDAAAFIGMNPKYPYVYFNPVAGGVSGAYGKYETDYWGVSVRQGLEWMEQQGILKPDMQETVVIATNMFYSASKLTAKYGDKVKVKYLKWEKRCDDAWDYALYPTRFIDGQTLQNGKWPPDNAVHLVTAGGAPLLAVLKDEGRNCAFGMVASKLNNWPEAISRFQAEVAKVPDNELAWAGLAQAYLNSNQPEEAKAAADKALEISPDDTQANNLIGMYWMEKGDLAKARNQFESALKREPANAAAWYFLGQIAANQNDAQLALNNLMKAIQLAPNFKPAYELSAQIYEATGDPATAQQYRAAAAQIK